MNIARQLPRAVRLPPPRPSSAPDQDESVTHPLTDDSQRLLVNHIESKCHKNCFFFPKVRLIAESYYPTKKEKGKKRYTRVCVMIKESFIPSVPLRQEVKALCPI